MSAADKREELETFIWRSVRDSAARPIGLDCERMDAILARADAYATAVASDALDGVVRAARQRDRRDAVAEALSAVRGASCPA